MVKLRTDTKTLDLFGWEPKNPKIPTYPHDVIKAATLGGRISRAVATTFSDAKSGETSKERDVIIADMASFLDEDVPISTVNGYCSQARESHNITVARAIALMHVTKDYRLLVLIAEELGLAVVPKRYEHAVREAILAEKRERIDEELKALRRGRR